MPSARSRSKKSISKLMLARAIDLATLELSGPPKPRSEMLPAPRERRKKRYRGPVLFTLNYLLGKKRVRVTLFVPVRRDNAYYCHLHIAGLSDKLRETGIYGEDQFQALQRATYLLEIELDKHRDRLRAVYSDYTSKEGNSGLALTILGGDELKFEGREKVRNFAFEYQTDLMRAQFRERRNRRRAASRAGK